MEPPSDEGLGRSARSWRSTGTDEISGRLADGALGDRIDAQLLVVVAGADQAEFGEMGDHRAARPNTELGEDPTDVRVDRP